MLDYFATWQMFLHSGKILASNFIFNQHEAKFNHYEKKISVQRPGIEPGPPAWQARILPLNQRC